jgi:uncharacterized membrane protein YbhN (UPF0104 family)
VDSLRSFDGAAGTFFHHLTDIAVQALLLALLLDVANLVLRSRAWLNILRAAYPDEQIRWLDVIGAYLAGAGINALLPFRGGDVVRIYAARQRIPHSTFSTVTSSTIAETIFDAGVSVVLFSWAYFSGNLPLRPHAPQLPAFEWGWLGSHLHVAVGLALVAFVLLIWAGGHLRRFWGRIAQGLAILHTPAAFFRKVVLFQALGWLCRVAAAYELLEAFHIHASIRNALLAIVVGSVSTMLPLTPGGSGAQQAMLAIVLSGAASGSRILAYSVGAQVATTAVRIVIGAGAMLYLFGHINPRRLHRAAAADQAAPKSS